MIITLSIFESILFYLFSFGFPCIVCKLNIENKALKFVLLVLPPILLGTIRYNVGYDYTSYIIGYHNSYDISYSEIFSRYKFGAPIGFDVLLKLIAPFQSDRLFLFVTSSLSVIPGAIYIYNDWNDCYAQPLMLFSYLFYQYTFALSAIKQGIAISLIIGSLHFLYKRKPVQFFSIIALASLFHSTAIVFSFAYFLVGKNNIVSSYKKVLAIACGFFLLMNFQNVTLLIFGSYYDSYFTDNGPIGKNRTVILFVTISIICVIFREYLIQLDSRNTLLIILIVIGTMCQFLGFYNAFMKRIGEYFTFAQTFLLPQLYTVVTDRSKPLYNIMLSIFIFTMFYIGNQTAASGMGFIPYKLCISI